MDSNVILGLPAVREDDAVGHVDGLESSLALCMEAPERVVCLGSSDRDSEVFGLIVSSLLLGIRSKAISSHEPDPLDGAIVSPVIYGCSHSRRALVESIRGSLVVGSVLDDGYPSLFWCGIGSLRESIPWSIDVLCVLGDVMNIAVTLHNLLRDGSGRLWSLLRYGHSGSMLMPSLLLRYPSELLLLTGTSCLSREEIEDNARVAASAILRAIDSGMRRSRGLKKRVMATRLVLRDAI